MPAEAGVSHLWGFRQVDAPPGLRIRLFMGGGRHHRGQALHQLTHVERLLDEFVHRAGSDARTAIGPVEATHEQDAVSYTHLTLPTSDLV